MNAERVSKPTCHSEGAFIATEESPLSLLEILRFAQDDILENPKHRSY